MNHKFSNRNYVVWQYICSKKNLKYQIIKKLFFFSLNSNIIYITINKISTIITNFQYNYQQNHAIKSTPTPIHITTPAQPPLNFWISDLIVSSVSFISFVLAAISDYNVSESRPTSLTLIAMERASTPIPAPPPPVRFAGNPHSDPGRQCVPVPGLQPELLKSPGYQFTDVLLRCLVLRVLAGCWELSGLTVYYQIIKQNYEMYTIFLQVSFIFLIQKKQSKFL
eukprot:TRINITY_DN3465_c1_g1_i3.p3 TRINITY_DN3465_c1_g1~~TRINITY_DN3465_c1_g1_i3.p3  ORF type:complete len:224 (+),score=1.81 TRINITY_DN3465_c1_g1_i3:1087-1758(+)